MGIVRSIKNVTGGYTSSQVKVRDATSNDDNPPPRMLMQEIADLTYDGHEVLLIMDMIDKRLNDKGKYWRHVQKSLILLDYLVHVGSEKVVLWCNENLYIVKTLREFNHRDDTGRDIGGPIRERATRLTSLLMDANRLEEERSRFARGGRNRRRNRRNSRSSPSRERERSDDDDDELARVLQLSKETAAQEEERRLMAGRPSADNDLQRAMEMSQQNQMDMQNGLAFQQQQQLLFQQQQEEAALAQAQQEYLQAQQQAQVEAQRLYEMQMAQNQQNAYQQQLLLQQQYDQQLQQQQQQQQQQQNPVQNPLQPLKTGSNNPFAAFNQQQADKAAQKSQEPLTSTSTGSRPYLHRQSTFDKDHMDRLDSILNVNATMDTFGNTGASMIPAQHTENTGFVDSSGRGLTAMLTSRQKTGTNNPFSSNPQTQQYTGIASTQMQPAHTGFGFGNANHSSANLIDL